MRFLVSIVAVMMFAGCTASNVNTQTGSTNGEPEWMHNFNYIKDKRNAIGCSGIHVKGKEGQKKLAISRAIEQIALQKKTKVDVSTYRKSVSNNLQVSRKSQTDSVQATQSEISTRVVDMYLDRNDKLCVLVVEE